ncbi:MAG: LysM peptidoglycan-binding domain-containing protein [Salinivenus sp.]
MRTLALGLVLGLLLPISVHGQAPSDSTYTVQSGDTLYRIAEAVGASVEALMRWNGLETTDALEEGQTLRVRPPNPSRGSDEDSVSPPPPTPQRDTTAPAPPDGDTTEAAPYGTHTVASGDTFIGLALRLGTTADTLFSLNGQPSDTLVVGDTLRLPRRFGPPTHVVDSSETLYSIAGEYGVSVRALRSLNDLDTTALQPGRRLRLPERPDAQPDSGFASPDTTGPAAVYPDAFAGRLMASGTAYDPDDYAVSHPSLPFGSVVLLSRPDEDTHTFARVLDRGPTEEDVLLDVSATVAERLDISSEDAPPVALRVVWRADE